MNPGGVDFQLSFEWSLLNPLKAAKTTAMPSRLGITDKQKTGSRSF